MASLSVRRYRPADAERVRTLHDEPMRELGDFVDGASDDDIDDIEGAYLDAGGEFLVGEHAGEIIAMGGYRPATGYITSFLPDLPPRTAELKRMRVDTDHQRQGYGQQVYDELERRARADGFTDIVLDSTTKQVGAQRLYEANGFEIVRREPVVFGEESFTLLF